MLNRKLISFPILILFLLVAPPAAWALRINNPSVKVQLDKGQTYSGAVAVTNPTLETVAVKVYLEDFVYVYPFDGSKDFYPPGSTEVSLSKWISYSPQEFTLEPYAYKEVRFTIRPDADLDRAHCGVLFFETAMGKGADPSGKDISVMGRLGSLIFVEPLNKNKAGEFSSWQGKARKLEAEFTNNGNSFLHTKGTYYLIDDSGVVADRGELPEYYMLCSDKVKMGLALPPDLKSGRYTMVMTVDLEDGDVLVQEVDFSCDSSGGINVIQVRK